MTERLAQTGGMTVSVNADYNRRDMFSTRSIMDSYDATKGSPASWDFGTSTRPPLTDSEETPGPGAYGNKSLSFGAIPDSRKRSAPQFTLRSREKFGDPLNKALDPTSMSEPGPGHYVSKKVNPKEVDAPVYSFPKTPAPRDRGVITPGPGQYKGPRSVGKQVLSTKRNQLGAEFGNSNRPTLMMTSAGDVGPGHYGVGKNSCREQVDSRKPTASMTKFGREARSRTTSMMEDHRPSPGDYKIASGIGGGGSGYVYKSAPKCSLGGRNKFGSPFA
uniref:Uncharacterized protein n=1 Tax=Octactis speculum TaxID=3111310 RepID=A0A7S2HT28_9STRA